MALGQILSQSLSRNEHFVAPVTRAPVSHPPASLSKNLNRLLSAAVVSPQFRGLLLSDPVTALAAGYNGENFQLTPAEYAAVTSLRVGTIREFATQLLHLLQHAPEAQSERGFAEIAKQSHEYISEQSALHSCRQEIVKSHSPHTAPSRRTRLTVAANDGYRGGYSAQM